MEFEIRPEPTTEERAAIAAALRELLDESGAQPGLWWRAGVRENVADGEEGY